ncbi:putative GPI-anchored protein pfl2 [Haliotis rufescens]|uniref:putative GPI-anchored protein pfl2 n=1 Tax=Haliotis rufescens TaxID=6454 RepID=UPI00201EE475|nr:putative GPI-anchored protein pfl2 [Haliotis rufescens]
MSQESDYVLIGLKCSEVKLFTLSVIQGDTRTGSRCIEGLAGTFTVQLQCSADEWIHVEQEAYGNGDAATCRLKSAQACSKVHTSNQNGLIVNCNGKQSCREAITATPQTNCNFTDAAAEVKYNCIKESMDMCSSVSTTVNGSVYLHSPGFPNSVGVNSSCVVRITGENIQVTLVEQRIKLGSLNISGDGNQLWTRVNLIQNNRLLRGTAAEVVIVYDNHYQNGSNVWIRVSASGKMNITSERQPLEASTTPVPTPTQAPSRSQDATSPSTLDTLTTAATTSTPLTSMDSLTTSVATTLRISNGITTLSEITTYTTAQGSTVTMTSLTSTALSSTHTDNGNIVLPLAVVCGVLVLIIVALIIYIMVIRLSRNSHGNSSNPETSVYYGVQSIPDGSQGEDDLIPTSGTTNTYSGLSHDVERNMYNGIQRNASEDGDEHSYGHINRSEVPSYVNSVSGDDPYIYA